MSPRTEAGRCPRCGSPPPPTSALAGHCPYCLLEAALGEFQKNSPRESDAQRKAQEWIGQIVKDSSQHLKNIKRLTAVEPPAELRAAVAAFQPIPTAVFEGVPGLTIGAGKGK